MNMTIRGVLVVAVVAAVSGFAVITSYSIHYTKLYEGLAITRAVVEAHGGRIGVASDVVSTRFELRLPTDDVAGA